MANAQRGEVEWNGRILRCTMNAMAEIEDVYGRPFFDVVDEELSVGQMRMKSLRTIVWAMLQTPDGQDRPTEAEVGTMIDVAGVKETAQAAGKAVEVAFPSDQQGDDASPPPTADGA